MTVERDSRDPNASTFDHVGDRPEARITAPTVADPITIQAIRFGPPADPRHGEIFAAGAIKAPARVPLTRAFDATSRIGWATIGTDGAAALELAPGVEVGKIRHVGLGFRVIEQTIDDGIRTIGHLEPLTLGVEFATPLPVVAGIGEEWAGYLAMCELTAAPAVQLEELKRAFYGGAQAMYFAILNATDAGDDAATEARLEALACEMSDYLRLFVKREGLS